MDERWLEQVETVAGVMAKRRAEAGRVEAAARQRAGMVAMSCRPEGKGRGGETTTPALLHFKLISAVSSRGSQSNKEFILLYLDT